MVTKMVKKKIIVKPVGKVVKRKVPKKPEWCCYNCGNPVRELEKNCTLTTSQNGKIVEEVYFHWDCWVEYFNNCVNKKAKENVAQVQKKVMGLMDNPLVKGLLSQVKGTDNLFSMLQMPLTEETVEKVKEKINDDRKRAKPKKAQMHKV